MAQFDVHRTRRPRVPYIVVVQCSNYDRLSTRVVIPLIRVPAPRDFDLHQAPVIYIEGVAVMLAPWQIGAIRAAALGPVVASLADDNDAARIIRGIDELISQAYR